jgi:hypothetical protein
MLSIVVVPWNSVVFKEGEHATSILRESLLVMEHDLGRVRGSNNLLDKLLRPFAVSRKVSLGFTADDPEGSRKPPS